MDAIRYQEIKRLAMSFRLGDLIRFVVAAPRFVHDLVEHVETIVRYYDDQLQRREADMRDLRGRRSVELEAAALNGYRQGFDQPRDHGDGVYEIVPVPLNMVEVRNAVAVAKPTEVTGELTMVGRARHS